VEYSWTASDLLSCSRTWECKALRIPLTSYGRGTVLLGSICLLTGVVVAALFLRPAGILFGLLWIGLLVFFRDPDRHADCSPDQLLSPADGTVRDVDQVTPPGFIEEPAIRVGIFMSVFDVHVNRSPADAAVRWTSYHPGAFHDARSTSAATQNEHHLLGLELHDGRKILVNQIAGLVARRIVCRPLVGDVLRRGQRFGMVKFGSRVELYLPVADGYEVVVRPGDRVRAGQSVLAAWLGRRDAPPHDKERRATTEHA
jgi:phosphatidylserine decarboxylase